MIKNIGKLQFGDKIFGNYFFDSRTRITTEKINSLSFYSNKEVMTDVIQKIQLIFKKQPIIGNLLKEVIFLKNSMYNRDEALKMSLLYSTELFNKLADRDISKHIKNNGYSWSKQLDLLKEVNKEIDTHKARELPDIIDKYIGLFNFEDIDDKIEAILLEQKAKRFIQKVYSKSYRHLVNDTTLNMFKIFIEKDISLSEINQGFGSKLARYDNIEEANNGLSKLVTELSGWSKSKYLKDAKKMGATIINDEDDSLILKIHSYEQSMELGSGQWCISYDKEQFIHYKGENNFLFFNYDFSKDPDDKMSMSGHVVNSIGSIINGHWRDDTITDNFSNNMEEINYIESFISKLPIKYTRKDIIEASLDSALAQDEDKRSDFLLNNNTDIQKIDVLTSAMAANVFSTTIFKTSLAPLCEIYKNTNIKKENDPVMLIKIKETKQFIRDYLKSSTVIYDTWYSHKKESALLGKMIKSNDFETIKIYVEKVDSISLLPLLNLTDIDFDNIENQNKVLDILNIYKESKATFPLKFDLLEPLYMMDMMGFTDKTDFFEKIFQINDGKIPLRHVLSRLDYNLRTEENILTKESNKKRTSLIKLALKHIDKKKLNDEIGDKNLKSEYPNIDKKLISEIKNAMGKKKPQSNNTLTRNMV